jgi:hypothetical protein
MFGWLLQMKVVKFSVETVPYTDKNLSHEDLVLDDLYLACFLKLFQVINLEQLEIVDELLFDHINCFFVKKEFDQPVKFLNLT